MENQSIVKEISDRYRRHVEKSKIIHLLLFNEADAVIGKQRTIANDGGNPDQTDNAIPSIILKKIENLKGILTAAAKLT